MVRARSRYVATHLLCGLLIAASALAKPPYPILLVHGLDSDGNAWVAHGVVSYLVDELGWSDGGTFNFNLDRLDTLADIWIDPALNPTYPLAGRDIYRINFSHAENDESNWGAIALQAKALQLSIAEVRRLTGAQKVLLVGHSMGGLASAAYILSDFDADNEPDFYGNDVAKLLTLGTPFGGAPLSTLIDLTPLVGLDPLLWTPKFAQDRAGGVRCRNGDGSTRRSFVGTRFVWQRSWAT